MAVKEVHELKKEEICVETQAVSTDIVGDTPKRLSFVRLSCVLTSLWIGVLLTVLNQTMIATILGPISSTFNSSEDLSWLATSYLIALAASQPLSGHLTDVFGRREGLILSHIAFGLGTLVCGLAHTKALFYFGRAVQGLGAGPIGAITAVVECDLVPLRQRGIVEGVGNVFYGVALGIGGVFGGLVNDYIGWKWAFLIQVPLVAAAALLVWFMVQIPKTKSDLSTLRRIDYVGIVTLLTSIILLQFGLNTGGTTLPWNSPGIVVSLVLAPLSFAIFAYWDWSKAREPLLAIRMFAVRNVSLTNLASFLTTATYMTQLFYVPLYLLAVSETASQAGLRLLSQAAGLAVGSFVVGWIINKTGHYYYLNIVSQVVFAIGSGLLVSLNLHSPSWATYVYVTITGLGFGGQTATILIALLSAVPQKQQSTAMSAIWSVRSLAMTVGLTIASVVFQKTLKSHLVVELHGQANEMSLIANLMKDFNLLGHVDSGVSQQVQNSYMTAFRGVFALALGEVGVAALLAFPLKEYPVPK